MTKALLLSNSTMPGHPFLGWPAKWITEFLGARPLRLLFLPFAGVTISHDEYAARVREKFESMGHALTSIHEAQNWKEAIAASDGFVVGGGNTFVLLDTMVRQGLLSAIKEKVESGVPYIGWSAGANLACPSIMTTNDMPVVAPPSLAALSLIPFQLNPHYHELRFEGQGGETRIERLQEFMTVNPDKKVLGLPEGMLVRRLGDKLELLGEGTAKLYRNSGWPKEVRAPADISFLLD